MRDKLLNEKANAIQTELEAWAKEHNVLKAGEQLFFSLRISEVPLVAHEKVNELLEMKPEEFFSIKRLVDMGAPRPLATRASHAVKWNCYKGAGHNMEVCIHTVREWLETYDTERVKRIPNLGKKSLEWIIRLMNENGIHLRDA